MTARTLVIKVTAGKDDPERCGQALTVAATALASGVAGSLWPGAGAPPTVDEPGVQAYSSPTR